MLTINDVSPIPVTGQYWAWLNPLSLLKVVQGSPSDNYNFTRWTSGEEGETELYFLAPLDSSNFRLLRFSISYSNEEISQHLGMDIKVRTGDVFELYLGNIVFAVLENGSVACYSYDNIDKGSRLILSVVQRGPGPPIGKPVKTRYERILDESNANLPLVRSVGGVILRPKEQGPLLPPATDSGPKNRTITNLQLLRSAELDRLYRKL
jgi:hypothetical protein